MYFFHARSYIYKAFNLNTMEKEIIETYHFNPQEFVYGRRADGTTFREVVKEFERDFHAKHKDDYAYLLYANSATMHLLEKGNGAAPFLSYGLELTKGAPFLPEVDGKANYEIDKHSKHVLVYGIDSAFMDTFDEDGDPIFGGDSGIYPITLLIDPTMADGTIRLAIPIDDDNDDEDVTVLIDQPKYKFA